MGTRIYHNPKCGTSRNVLEHLRQAGIEPEIIEYVKTPLTKKQLTSLVKKTGVPVREILRKKGTPYDELKLDDPSHSDDALIDFVVEHPILMNRPIVETDNDAKLCRPSETVLEYMNLKNT